MASSSVAALFEHSVHNDLATLPVESGASDHYFDDAIIHELKNRLQDYVHLATPHKLRTAGGAMRKGTAEGVL